MIVMPEEISPIDRTLYVFELMKRLKNVWRKQEEYKIKAMEEEKKNRMPEGGCIGFY